MGLIFLLVWCPSRGKHKEWQPIEGLEANALRIANDIVDRACTDKLKHIIHAKGIATWMQSWKAAHDFSMASLTAAAAAGRTYEEYLISQKKEAEAGKGLGNRDDLARHQETGTDLPNDEGGGVSTMNICKLVQRPSPRNSTRRSPGTCTATWLFNSTNLKAMRMKKDRNHSHSRSDCTVLSGL